MQNEEGLTGFVESLRAVAPSWILEEVKGYSELFSALYKYLGEEADLLEIRKILQAPFVACLSLENGETMVLASADDIRDVVAYDRWPYIIHFIYDQEHQEFYGFLPENSSYVRTLYDIPLLGSQIDFCIDEERVRVTGNGE